MRETRRRGASRWMRETTACVTNGETASRRMSPDNRGVRNVHELAVLNGQSDIRLIIGVPKPLLDNGFQAAAT